MAATTEMEGRLSSAKLTPTPSSSFSPSLSFTTWSVVTTSMLGCAIDASATRLMLSFDVLDMMHDHYCRCRLEKNYAYLGIDTAKTNAGKEMWSQSAATPLCSTPTNTCIGSLVTLFLIISMLLMHGNRL